MKTAVLWSILLTFIYSIAIADEQATNDQEVSGQKKAMPWKDLRDKDLSEKEIEDIAQSTSTKHKGLVYLYKANRSKSSPDVDVTHDDFDSFDGTIYEGLQKAAQELNAEGFPFTGIFVASSFDGKDSLEIFFRGQKNITVPHLVASTNDHKFPTSIKNQSLAAIQTYITKKELDELYAKKAELELKLKEIQRKRALIGSAKRKLRAQIPLNAEERAFMAPYKRESRTYDLDAIDREIERLRKESQRK